MELGGEPGVTYYGESECQNALTSKLRARPDTTRVLNVTNESYTYSERNATQSRAELKKLILYARIDPDVTHHGPSTAPDSTRAVCNSRYIMTIAS
jgi:hypothetical protein